MSKPRTKAEARWKYWREENPRDRADKFKTWAKKAMRKALRRFTKEEVRTAPREPEYDPREYVGCDIDGPCDCLQPSATTRSENG